MPVGSSRVCGERIFVASPRMESFSSSPRLRGTHNRNTVQRPFAPVHPRTCGERSRARKSRLFYGGSSPRLRGTLPEFRRLPNSIRFIPAPAGNALPPAALGLELTGSSPRLRGTHAIQVGLRLGDRFIPAPAGNASRTTPPRRPGAVHPRACGERFPACEWRQIPSGSSPRLRGTRNGSLSRWAGYRFIPAPAGNALAASNGCAAGTVHPRACGERVQVDRRLIEVGGSSPRLRGTPGRATRRSDPLRFIPAPAGNAGKTAISFALPAVHPRACGERDLGSHRIVVSIGSSPRLRGTLRTSWSSIAACRFIPAPAGNASARTQRKVLGAVHPRACGERDQVRPRRQIARRFIPAPAGNAWWLVADRFRNTVHPRACGERLIMLCWSS